MKEKQKSAVIRIDDNIHEQVRKYCSDNGLKIGFFASQALKAAMVGKSAPVNVE